jgi:hypothetical protein
MGDQVCEPPLEALLPFYHEEFTEKPTAAGFLALYRVAADLEVK